MPTDDEIVVEMVLRIEALEGHLEALVGVVERETSHRGDDRYCPECVALNLAREALGRG